MNNEFYSRSHLIGTRNDYYFQATRAELLSAKGDWNGALELNRILREELQQGEFIQSITARNLAISTELLELNRFGYSPDLTEARNRLEEIIEIDGFARKTISNFLLVTVYLRQNRKSAAQDQFIFAQDVLSPASRDNNLFRVLFADAEFELAFAESHWDKAVEASRTSIEIYKNCYHRWGWSRRLINLGDALVGRNEPGDLERAQETYQQSLDMFTKMGAPGYIKVLEERILGISE